MDTRIEEDYLRLALLRVFDCKRVDRSADKTPDRLAEVQSLKMSASSLFFFGSVGGDPGTLCSLNAPDGWLSWCRYWITESKWLARRVHRC